MMLHLLLLVHARPVAPLDGLKNERNWIDYIISLNLVTVVTTWTAVDEIAHGRVVSGACHSRLRCSILSSTAALVYAAPQSDDDGIDGRWLRFDALN